jgi:hypothetical protein
MDAMQAHKNDVWVGLFVHAGAAALVFLALQSANLLSLNFQLPGHGASTTSAAQAQGGGAQRRRGGGAWSRSPSTTRLPGQVTLSLENATLSPRTARSRS